MFLESPSNQGWKINHNPRGIHKSIESLYSVGHDYVEGSSHFPSKGSDDPPLPPPLGIENVKIQENSEKIRGPPGGP